MNNITAGGVLSSLPASLPFFFLSPFSNQRAINWPCILLILSRTNPPVLRDPWWPHVTWATKPLVGGTLLLKWCRGLIFFLLAFVLFAHDRVYTTLQWSKPQCFPGLDGLQWRHEADFSPSGGSYSGGEMKKGQQECLSSNNTAPKVCLRTGAVCCSSCATWNPAVLFEFQQDERKCWLCNHRRQVNGQKQKTFFIFSLPLSGQYELLHSRSFNQRPKDESHYFLAKTKINYVHPQVPGVMHMIVLSK